LLRQLVGQGIGAQPVQPFDHLAVDGPGDRGGGFVLLVRCGEHPEPFEDRAADGRAPVAPGRGAAPGQPPGDVDSAILGGRGAAARGGLAGREAAQQRARVLGVEHQGRAVGDLQHHDVAPGLDVDRGRLSGRAMALDAPGGTQRKAAAADPGLRGTIVEPRAGYAKTDLSSHGCPPGNRCKSERRSLRKDLLRKSHLTSNRHLRGKSLHILRGLHAGGRQMRCGCTTCVPAASGLPRRPPSARGVSRGM
jgi:hypothetical protein